MTNIVPFNQAALPAFMQQLAGAANINDQAAAGIGGESIDHISIKGGRFHIIRNGQPYRTPFPPGQAVERYPRIGWDRPKASDHCPVVMALEL